jgi:hypothetical protein
VTDLTKPVKRVYRRRADRPLVVTLVPEHGDQPARIEIREMGRRSGPSIEVGRLYVRLVQAQVSERAIKRRKRRGSWLTGA